MKSDSLRKSSTKSKQIPTYEPLTFRGEGVFGCVIEALDMNTNEKVAIKKVARVTDEFSREMAILEEVKSHPNIINLKSVFFTVTDDNLEVMNLVFDYHPSSYLKRDARQISARPEGTT